MKPRNHSLRDCSALLLDIGGTLQIGDTVVDGARTFIKTVKKKKIKTYVLSNTTSISADTISHKLNDIGLSLTTDEIITANTAALAYMQHEGIKNAFIIGTEEQKEEFKAAGIEIVTDQAEAVVISWDPELNYAKLTVADALIRRGARFIATNTDEHIVTSEGLIPDAGGTIGFLKAVTNQEPEMTGKPSKLMMDIVRERVGLPGYEMAIIGDQLDVDMKMAEDFGMTSVLVLTGKTKREDLQHHTYQPDYIVESIENLTPLFS